VQAYENSRRLARDCGSLGASRSTKMQTQVPPEVPPAEKLSFVRPHPNIWGDKGVMLTLSVAKLDAAWRSLRVPPGGEPYCQGKYRRAKQWIGSYGRWSLRAPTIDTDGKDRIYFVDGRNRFAALRDLGYEEVKVWAHHDQAKKLLRKYSLTQSRKRRHRAATRRD
jgi:hypothetical protein